MSKENTAIIGYTGFVGSNVVRQFQFSDLYNSTNITNIGEKQYKFVVSAAPSAVKWKANKFPAEDRAHVLTYLEQLKNVNAEECICISTCDVYVEPTGVNEFDDPHLKLENLHPYGKHRLMIEDFVKSFFPKSHIIRLPALFGPGLKKNVIFDFLNNNQIENIDHRNQFQFYDLSNVWSDIERARDEDVPILNITSEPITVSELARNCFGMLFENITTHSPVTYDIRSMYSEKWGGSNGYLYSKESVLKHIKMFITDEKSI
jgi:nucleoside-diphosphate-sugar epimerase